METRLGMQGGINRDLKAPQLDRHDRLVDGELSTETRFIGRMLILWTKFLPRVFDMKSCALEDVEV